MSKDFTPVFKNDQGVAEIETGARHFGCVGQTPPFDHPHIYLEIPASGAVKCPYCATIYRFNPELAEDECRPDDARFIDEDAA